MIYTVICTDVSDYINWQCELLEYSWARVQQPGELVRLVCAPPDAEPPRSKHTRVVRIAEPSGRTGGYLAFERLFSLRDWLERERPQGTVLIVDPDCVFRIPIGQGVEPGSPSAQHWVDYRAQPPAQPATWPAMIHTDDLARLLPVWIDFTRAIFGATRRWESDMYALVSASASLGLKFSLDQIGAFVGWPDAQVRGAPIVHYCQNVTAADGRVLWSKRTYRPWSQVRDADQAQHDYCRDLLAIVNEFAATRTAAAPSAQA